MASSSFHTTREATPTSGSQTITANASSALPSATLRLRGEAGDRRRIQWAEDVVDNEGMGKKSSKVCCIYHKPHEPGDSDSEGSSSSNGSESGSDSEPDFSRAQKAGGKKGKDRKDHHHKHNHDGDHGSGGRGNDKAKSRRPSPNAYERQPKPRSRTEG